MPVSETSMGQNVQPTCLQSIAYLIYLQNQRSQPKDPPITEKRSALNRGPEPRAIIQTSAMVNPVAKRQIERKSQFKINRVFHNSP